MAQVLRCSFCLKTQHQVRKLVAGPGVHICDRCVRAASRIIDEPRPPPSGGALWRRFSERIRNLMSELRSVSRSSLRLTHTVQRGAAAALPFGGSEGCSQ